MWALMGIWAINQTIIDNNDDCAAGTHTNANCETVPDLQVTFQWGREVRITKVENLLHLTNFTEFFNSYLVCYI